MDEVNTIVAHIRELESMASDEKEYIGFLKDSITALRVAKNKAAKKLYQRLYMRKRRNLYWMAEREATRQEKETLNALWPENDYFANRKKHNLGTRTPRFTKLPRLTGSCR